MSIAIISDIHSNLFALEAVMRDIEARGIDQIVNLGDSLFGPIAPIETAQLLMSFPALINIMGNCDRYLLENGMESETFRFVKPLLTEHICEWVRTFEKTRVIEDLLFCHGTPFSDDAYLVEEVTMNGVRRKMVDVLVKELSAIPQKVIYCGHTHVRSTVWLPDGKMIINPGSVGLPAYYEEEPYPHVMESMTPHAEYGIARSGRAAKVG